MGRKIVEVLYIVIYVGLFLLAGYSLLFESTETSKLEDLCIMLFGGILSLTLVACVLLDDEGKI